MITTPEFIGRKKEMEVLQKALNSGEAEMVSVIGRRRIGKTHLVKTFYKDHIVFEASGVKNARTEDQLLAFEAKLIERFGAKDYYFPINSWLTAFFALSSQLTNLPEDKKSVIFFDEIPWFSAQSTDFVQGLSWFWNSWAVNHNVVVVICGSSASWMIQKIVNDTGGLHNRITRRLYLKPFTLAETEQYLKSRNIYPSRYHILQIYMAMGGIPHYLKEIEPGKSAAQIIDDVCFSETGILKDEFPNLFSSLFDDSHNHLSVIRALAQTRQGLDRARLSKNAKVPNDATLTLVLQELQQSGFIEIYQHFAQKDKDRLIRVTDEYSLFYLQFIENQPFSESETWMQLSQSQDYKIWSGYAFESICFKHLSQIKKAMSIAGMYSVASSFYKKGTATQKGTQIDLVLDRKDQCINIFECKFYNETFSITKEYAQNLQSKMRIFREATKTKKHLFLTMLTTFGMEHNQHSLGLVDQILTVDDLFLE